MSCHMPVRSALRFGILAALAGGAHARTQSAIGAEARGTVSISASVKPVFNATMSNHSVSISSNASTALRYAIVIESAAGPTAGRDSQASAASANSGFDPLTMAEDAASHWRAGQDQIVLIVPD